MKWDPVARQTENQVLVSQKQSRIHAEYSKCVRKFLRVLEEGKIKIKIGGRLCNS